MQLVLDASVCLKWFLSEHANEPDSGIAFELLERVRDTRVHLLQPPIWHCEVASVLARILPRQAQEMTGELLRLRADFDDSPSTLMRATALSSQLDHHLFDTIYHAIAIQHRITLITADAHYYRKAQALGHIALLGQWRSARVSETPEKYTVAASKRRAPRRPRR
jgi:predicted nucleic acid-binding protein